MTRPMMRRTPRAAFAAWQICPFFVALAIVLAATSHAFARSQDVQPLPTWLAEHVGDHDGQIAPLVLQRARTLYHDKLAEGRVNNGCYMAMDATRPNIAANGKPATRFYVICEAARTYRAFSAGHGAGRNLPGLPDFSNGRQCAKNFGDAADSFLTEGGGYVTAETKTSFKGYYRAADGRVAAFVRTFIQFDGQGETASARDRAIGGHAAATMKNVCLRRDPTSAFANPQGYVPFGSLVEYAGGRSDGCTSWSTSDAAQIVALVKDNPTTLYIYPGRADIDAVARAAATHLPLASSGPYWNPVCLRNIGSPKYWSEKTLGPSIAAYEKSLPPPAARPTPLCKE